MKILSTILVIGITLSLTGATVFSSEYNRHEGTSISTTKDMKASCKRQIALRTFRQLVLSCYLKSTIFIFLKMVLISP